MSAALLDPQVVAKLGTLQLRVRQVVEGVLTGLHKSPHHGQSIEFAEHKEYAPGDEVKLIDWKAYGKFDKYYVKRFETETNLRAYVVVDCSGSMGYGAPLSKLDYAKVLGASIAYVLTRQQDAAGLLLCGGGAPAAMTFLPPRASAAHLTAVVSALEAARGDGPADLGAALDFLAEKARRRAAIFVLSDLFDESGRALAALRRLRRRRNEVAVFHTLDKDELEFPFDDPMRFLGMEDDRQLEANARDIRDSYLEEIARFQADTRRALGEADVAYELARTDEPLDRALVRFLARREAGA